MCRCEEAMTWGYNGCESVQPRAVCGCELSVGVREGGREREQEGVRGGARRK